MLTEEIERHPLQVFGERLACITVRAGDRAVPAVQGQAPLVHFDQREKLRTDVEAILPSQPKFLTEAPQLLEAKIPAPVLL